MNSLVASMNVKVIKFSKAYISLFTSYMFFKRASVNEAWNEIVKQYDGSTENKQLCMVVALHKYYMHVLYVRYFLALRSTTFFFCQTYNLWCLGTSDFARRCEKRARSFGATPAMQSR